MIRFFAMLALTAALLVGAVHSLVYFDMMVSPPSYFKESLIFLFFSTSIIFVYVYKAAKNLFVQIYLLTMVFKLLAYGAFVMFIVVQDKPDAFGNVVFFLMTYFIFTFLEVAFLYQRTRS